MPRPSEEQPLFDPSEDVWPAMKRISKDLRQAAESLTKREVRYVVDAYYQSQKNRMRSANQVRAEPGQPNRLLSWLNDSMVVVENQIRITMGAFAASYTCGRWLQAITGIGPVISGGLMGYLDTPPPATVGHWWSFAGLEPNIRWQKGEERPYCVELKTLLAYKLGECFVKVQNNKNDFYGKLFRKRKDLEMDRNSRGQFSVQATQALDKFRFGDQTKAKEHYLRGQLPPAHIHARARRWTVKLFLSHLHEVMWRDYYQTDPVRPYAFVHCEQHTDFIPPPNWPVTNPGKRLTELVG